MKLASSSKQIVAIQLNDQLNKDIENTHSALMTIFTNLRFLYRQRLSIWGHGDISSNFIHLLELQNEDVPGLKELMGHSNHKGLLHDIQTKIIDILGKSVLRSVVCEMKKREHFTIIVVKTCDISIHEQVIFCIRSVEDFVGLYETPNTEGKTLFGIVKDTLTPLDINIKNLQGQC
ncbi:hypothetical protein PR048_009269 [Dryococelus australis]|uniref:Uncharacterized protein n=1 Tax=Dryococelus australis TaxID=614101 RepID=A0ABQ9HZE2_9NEOP|nr:hypothetical protein PR048_009269 [Dryococelus australis]